MNDDFLDLISEFNRAKVEFLLVGGYAVGIHGHPRATKDLDLWVRATPANAERTLAALDAFGAPLASLTTSDLATPGYGFMMGVPPRRIDVITVVSGLDFEDAWPRRIETELAASRVFEGTIQDRTPAQKSEIKANSRPERNGPSLPERVLNS